MRWILSFIPFLFCVYSQAQNEFTYFNQIYGADSMNIFSTIVEPIEDGYLIMGPYVSTNYDALYIRKIDKKGNTVWFKNIEENIYTGTIEGREVIRVDERNFAIVYTYFYNNEDWQPQLVKFDIEGSIIFHKEFADTNIIRNARQLITTQDKGFAFVGGKRIYNPSALATFYLIKTDSLGNQEWEQTYDFEGFSSIAHSIQQTPDGGYILGGYTQTGSANTNNDMFVVKTDSLGNEEWSKTIGGGWDDCPAIVHCLTSEEEYQQTGDIEYLISGCYIDEFSSAENRYEIYLFKLDTQGQIIWEQGHNPYPIMHRLRVQVVLPDKSFYGVGVRSVNLYWSPVLYRFNADGALLWKKELLIDSLASYYIRDMQPTEDGGFVLAGFRNTPHPQHSWVLKIDSLGNTCMPADCDSTVVFTDIEEMPIPKNPFSLSLYPNPASEQVEVTYQVPKDGILKVYDYQGRLIDSWKLKMDNSSLTLKVEDWTSGVYLYSVEIEGERIEHGKILCR